MDVRAKITEFLDSKISLTTFNAWIARADWIADTVGHTDPELLNRCKLLIAEYTSGHRTEEDLRGCLSQLVARAG